MLKKEVAKGKVVFLYNGKVITPSKYYQLRQEMAKKE